jgi:hypothetical protein
MAKLSLLVFAFLLCGCSSSHRIGQDDAPTSTARATPDKRRDDLVQFRASITQFKRGVFASYMIRLCADVPNDKNPKQVLYKNEPGHVFLIFQQFNETDTISLAFGYYPKKPANVILFKNVKSELRNNRNRMYDCQFSRSVTEYNFFDVLDSAVVLAGKKYNLNHFNCYDYAVRVFNLSAGNYLIPVQYVKFPFIWGKGGSPTGLYRQLKALKDNDSTWSNHIEFGQLKAPDDDSSFNPN